MPRDVPLGGPRAMNVRRALPQRKRSLIGAWCFIDHYGSDDVWLLGSLGGSASPVATHSPLLGAELLLRPGASVRLAVDPTHEHGILVDSGKLTVRGLAVDGHQLAYVSVDTAEMFGLADDDPRPPLRAPAVPNARLRPRS